MQTRSFFQISLCLITVVFLLSCNKDDRLFCTKGKGDIVSENRNHSEFNRIYLETNANVFVTIDTEYGVRVESYENIAPLIKTNQEGSRLRISRDECIRRTNDHINVYISTSDINALEITGSGNIIVQNTFNTFRVNNKISGSGSITFNANVQELNNTISGSGNIHLTGSTNIHNIDISGSGDVRAYNMQSTSADINISGSGNADVWVTGKLVALISGSGVVRYIGFPTTDVEITGSGSVLNMNSSGTKF
ncbi:MAG: DUF2807 domain-containing protein [Chitinophagaceae bacterium]|nr:MAG: DUF2807 domain-containing protein [Chitinophagaceae bacterium]